jgi:hypothetical protein
MPQMDEIDNLAINFILENIWMLDVSRVKRMTFLETKTIFLILTQQKGIAYQKK